MNICRGWLQDELANSTQELSQSQAQFTQASDDLRATQESLARVTSEHDALQYTHQETALSLKAMTERNAALHTELDALSAAAAAAARQTASSATTNNSTDDDEVREAARAAASAERRTSIGAMATELSSLDAELACLLVPGSVEEDGADDGEGEGRFRFGPKEVAEKALVLGRSLQEQMELAEERHAEEIAALQAQLLAVVSSQSLLTSCCSLTWLDVRTLNIYIYVRVQALCV
jgi:hypothetical protein